MALPDVPFVFYPVAAFAILLTGISKGGFAGAAGGLAVPLMTLFVDPAMAAGIMLPILCAMDIFSVHAYRGKWSRKHLAALVPGALVGIVLGGLAFGVMSADAVRLIVGVISVTFALNQAFGITQRVATRLAAEPVPPGRVAGMFWGTASGFTSTLAHAGGPPFAIWMLPQKLDRTTLVATSAVFFLVVNYVKLLPYALLDMFPATNLATSAVLMPAAILGTFAGVWLHKRVNDKLFYQFCYGFTFLTGCKLLFDGVAGVIG